MTRIYNPNNDYRFVHRVKPQFPFLTLESLVELVLAKDNPQVMQGAGVKLHPENHVPTRAAEALVVALELRKGGETAATR